MIFWKLFRRIYETETKKMCQQIKDFVLPGENILDLGCGSGIFGKNLKEKLKVKVFGLDIVDERVFKIPFQKFDGKKIPFPENSFDTVLISFVLHHTENPKEILKEAKRVAKKIIIFEDLPQGILGKLRCFLHWLSWNLFFGKKFVKFNFLKEKEWEEIFENLNLKIVAKKDFFPHLWFLDPVKRKIFVLKK